MTFVGDFFHCINVPYIMRAVNVNAIIMMRKKPRGLFEAKGSNYAKRGQRLYSRNYIMSTD